MSRAAREFSTPRGPSLAFPPSRHRQGHVLAHRQSPSPHAAGPNGPSPLPSHPRAPRARSNPSKKEPFFFSFLFLADTLRVRHPRPRVCAAGPARVSDRFAPPPPPPPCCGGPGRSLSFPPPLPLLLPRRPRRPHREREISLAVGAVAFAIPPINTRALAPPPSPVASSLTPLPSPLHIQLRIHQSTATSSSTRSPPLPSLSLRSLLSR